jgi:MerR family transcriptional regulator, thiopeptide resistance regulator
MPTSEQRADTWTVGELAQECGITVRTLHHYDEIGLLRPSGRSSAGYRQYTADDVVRLRSIVVYRRLGFSLADVAVLLDDPDIEPADHLRRQHAVVSARIEGDRELLAALERALEAEMDGVQLTKEEQRQLFGGEFAEKFEGYEQEAAERWGDTDAWRQSRERTRTYTKAHWEQIKAEADDVNGGFLAAMRSGEQPTSTPAMDAAEAHRRHICRWFYDCPPQMHRSLGDLYVADQRFAANYERVAPGLAAYVRAAIMANAERQG